MNTVIGTLLVPFGETATGADGAIIAEWDDTLNVAFAGKVLNTYMSAGKRYFVVRDGNSVRVMTATDVKSQFIPGELIYLLVHAAPQVTITAVKLTHGRVTETGIENMSRSEEIGFPLADEAHGLQYLPAAYPSFAWFGNVGRDIEVAGNQMTVKEGDFPCLARISYPVQFTRYAVQTPKVTLAKGQTHPILVCIYYEIEVPA